MLCVVSPLGQALGIRGGAEGEEEEGRTGGNMSP